MNRAGYEIRETVSGQTFRCLPDQSVLSAMEQQGKRCVPVGCRGGGCVSGAHRGCALLAERRQVCTQLLGNPAGAHGRSVLKEAVGPSGMLWGPYPTRIQPVSVHIQNFAGPGTFDADLHDPGHVCLRVPEALVRERFLQNAYLTLRRAALVLLKTKVSADQ